MKDRHPLTSHEDGYWKVIPEDGSVYERVPVVLPSV